MSVLRIGNYRAACSVQRPWRRPWMRPSIQASTGHALPSRFSSVSVPSGSGIPQNRKDAENNTRWHFQATADYSGGYLLPRLPSQVKRSVFFLIRLLLVSGNTRILRRDCHRCHRQPALCFASPGRLVVLGITARKIPSALCPVMPGYSRLAGRFRWIRATYWSYAFRRSADQAATGPARLKYGR